LGLERAPLTRVRLQPSLFCGDITVINDTAALCRGLVDSTGLDARPVTGSLEPAIPWPDAATFLPASPEAAILVMEAPAITLAVPRQASTGSTVAVFGVHLQWEFSIAALTVGGLPCSSTPSFGPTSIACQLPDAAKLSSFAHRAGSLLHILLTLVSGFEAAMLGAVRLVGSIAASWREETHAPIVVMPSSATHLFPVDPDAIALRVDGLGATECEVSPDGAEVVGVSRVAPAPGDVAEVQFPRLGLAARLDATVTLLASCSDSGGYESSPVSPRSVRIPAAHVVTHAPSIAWLQAAAASTDAVFMPALNATLRLSHAPSNPGFVAQLFLCSVLLTSRTSQIRGEATTSSINGTAIAVRFSRISLISFPPGSRLAVASSCEWLPTGEVVQA